MKVDQKKLDEHLKKLKLQPCPLCGKRSWIPTDIIFQILEFHQDHVALGGPAIPVVPITCGNCGNTYFINAIVAGFIDSSDDKDKEAKQDEKK